MTTAADPHEALRLFATRAYPALGQKSYYQLLNVARESDSAAVRAAFYKVAAQLHPDRFQFHPDAETRERLESIYARICEAYRVLMDGEKRAAYDRGLAAGQLRLASGGREQKATRSPEDCLVHADARKFFRLAMACASRNDWKGAVMNLNFARSFEPGAALIAEKLEEAQARIRAATPGSKA